MHLVWIRTEGGKTVIEDLEVPSTKEIRGYETPVIPITGVIFRTAQPEVSMDFHNAPRRQIVLPLQGEVEIETGDGDSRIIGAGMALLADDVNGQGHKSKFSPNDAVTLFLLLPDELDPSQWRVDTEV
ncbi:MAG: hypothetical protein CL450_08740 [Acidimicrobiaceae bacterium]|nr:hypothetical protein [Acidimicrobiaceae bacterium]